MNTYKNKVILTIPTGVIFFNTIKSLARLPGILDTHFKAFETLNLVIEFSRQLSRIQRFLEGKLTKL